MSQPKIAYVMDPFSKVDINTDSTFAMIEEAQERNFQNFFLTPQDLFYKDNQILGAVQSVQVKRQPDDFYSLAPKQILPMTDMDVLMMRKDPPFNMGYILTTYLLELAQKGALVINDPQTLRDANEKLFALYFPELIPDTLVSADISLLKEFIADMKSAIIKPIDEKGGAGIFLVHAGDSNINALLSMMTNDGQRFIIIQRYIPEAKDGDKRVLLVNGEIKGSFKRVPSKDDHRGNLSAGAIAVACELTPRDRQICDILAPVFKEKKIPFVGIDIIGGYLIEINITSPTGIQEVKALQGLNVAADLMDFVQEVI